MLALTEATVLSVAKLARKVEAFFGVPQDIAWALSGGKLDLLQVRSITTLPIEDTSTAIAPPPGFWERADSHYHRFRRRLDPTPRSSLASMVFPQSLRPATPPASSVTVRS